MSDAFDPYKGESGLLDDYNGVIVDAVFMTSPQYNDGKTTFLSLTLMTDNPDVPLTDNRYTCGPDWASYDGGETVEHPSKKLFQNQTQIFQLYQTILGLGDDVAQVVRERGYAVQDTEGKPLGPRAASPLVGLGFHWKIKTDTIKFTDRNPGSPTNGQQIERQVNRPLPDKFLGRFVVGTTGEGEFAEWTVNPPVPVQGGAPSPTPAGPSTASAAAPAATDPGSVDPTVTEGEAVATAAAPVAAPAAATAAVAAPAATEAPTAPSVTDPADTTMAQLRLLAQAKATYEEFVDAALPVVAGNDTLIAKLGDPTFYNDLKQPTAPAAPAAPTAPTA